MNSNKYTLKPSYQSYRTINFSDSMVDISIRLKEGNALIQVSEIHDVFRFEAFLKEIMPIIKTVYKVFFTHKE